MIDFIDHVFTDRIVAANVVIGGILLAADEMAWIVVVLSAADANLVDYFGRSIDK